MNLEEWLTTCVPVEAVRAFTIDRPGSHEAKKSLLVKHILNHPASKMLAEESKQIEEEAFRWANQHPRSGRRL